MITKKWKTVFIHNFKEINYYTNIIYRDRNNLFIKDSLTGEWYGTSENLIFETTNYMTKTKTPFNVSGFFGDFYEVQKKGTGYVMETLVEWRKLVPKEDGHLIPFIVRRTPSGRIDAGITRNVIFLTPPRELRTQTKEGILKNCKY